MCINGIEIYAQNTDTILCLFVQHNWEGLCDHIKSKMIFTLGSYNFCIHTPILKLEWPSDPKLLPEWDNFEAHPTERTVYGV